MVQKVQEPMHPYPSRNSLSRIIQDYYHPRAAYFVIVLIAVIFICSAYTLNFTKNAFQPMFEEPHLPLQNNEDLGSIQNKASKRSFLDTIATTSSPDEQKDAVNQMISRLFPGRESEFNITIVPPRHRTNHDAFTYTTDAQSRLILKATSGVAAALGFHHYLKEFGKCHISWWGRQLNLAKPLPKVHTPVSVTAQDRFTYNANVCTFGYSYVWWDWSRWEQEIDWMALNGINMPLAFVGQELIFQRVFLKLGVTQDQLDNWFSGPAFLPWFRMGNLIRWAGPLSQEYIDNQATLQRNIVNRMRQFGMTPVLPAFSGRVPFALKQLYPNASIETLAPWGNWNCNYSCTQYVTPTDPLYNTISAMFISEITKEYGTDHLYNVDPWNEMLPTNNTVEYLANASENILASLRKVDRHAIWVLQAWMFTFSDDFWTQERAKAFLTAVPLGSILVLDLAAEYVPVYPRYESFYGQPFIWNMLNNYGGRSGLFGHMVNVNEDVFTAREYANSTMVGTGLTMEAIGTNEILYELMNEMHYRMEPVDLDVWIYDYTIRRYGFTDVLPASGWIRLSDTAYNNYALGYQLVIRRPMWGISWDNYPNYNVSATVDAIHAFMACVKRTPSYILQSSTLFLHDLVDLWREMLFVLLCQTYDQLYQDYLWIDASSFSKHKDFFLYIMDDMEDLLASHGDFLLGPWVTAAESLATTESDRVLFRYNALNQVTLWGDGVNGSIPDYASKQWSGLMRDYYRPRWQMFLEQNLEALILQQPFKEQQFRDQLLTTVEQPFSYTNRTYTTIPNGDTIVVATYLYDKYLSWLGTLHVQYTDSTEKYSRKYLREP